MRMIKPQAGATTLTSKEMLLCQLYVYQKFKPSYILAKINCLNYSTQTIKFYLSCIRTYLNNNQKSKVQSKSFYNVIDRCKTECLDILIPSEKDKCSTRKSSIKSEKQVCFGVKPDLDETKINISQSTRDKLNKKILYGIWLNNDNIKIFNSYEQLKGYINCAKDYGIKTAFQAVQLQCEVLNDF